MKGWNGRAGRGKGRVKWEEDGAKCEWTGTRRKVGFVAVVHTESRAPSGYMDPCRCVSVILLAQV